MIAQARNVGRITTTGTYTAYPWLFVSLSIEGLALGAITGWPDANSSGWNRENEKPDHRAPSPGNGN